MNKTPVSILQEMMVKKGTIPNYELICSEKEANQNIFTYRVSCDNLKAIGTGRCKKDAKHEAATAMLEAIGKQNGLLQLPSSSNELLIEKLLLDPSPAFKSPVKIPFQNTIGELQELCSTNNLNLPEYKETGNEGPAHAKIFTIQCLVSTFVETGIASTKKQAKHEAARRMLSRIKEVVIDSSQSISSEIDEKRENDEVHNKLVIDQYVQLSKTNNKILKAKPNWGIKIEKYYQYLHEKFNEEKRNDILIKLHELQMWIKEITIYEESDFEEVQKYFDSFLQLLDMEGYFQLELETCLNDHLYVVSVSLNTSPDIVEIAVGKTVWDAKINSIKRILNTLETFLE